MNQKRRDLYSMRVATRLSGLTPDTIRKWEERYRAVVPKRTNGGTRKFSPADIRRLNLLRELTARGHHIQDVAAEATPRLEELLQEIQSAPRAAIPNSQTGALDSLSHDYLDWVRVFDGPRAAGLLSRAAALLRPLDFVDELALPLLRWVGEAWAHGEAGAAHEHLVSAQLHGILLSMLHSYAPQPGAARILVTTPEGHHHEFGALIGALLAAHHGFAPIYLGPNLPADDILSAVELSRASLVLLSIVRNQSPGELEPLEASLRQIAAEVPVWIGIPEGHALLERKIDARLFHGYEELKMALVELAVRAG